ncbi:MAG: polysaccharide deacetylase family protein [Deltaproteobacteria bacterium]|jgi:peptidoglycan/xylan/chitin deacetylase (PgdA/CDA1 family)|nr:polysaccharide deacetylase family protein [Deltaproteobacteria bacterium]
MGISRRRVRGVFLIALLAGLALMTSCAWENLSRTFSEPALSRGKPGERVVFRSEDYAVLRLGGDEKAESLAREFLGDPRKAWVIAEANRGATFAKDQMIVVPLKEENKGGLTAEGCQIVPVLCYHHFAERCDSSLCTPTSVFEQQMRFLKEEGYSVISTAELGEFLAFRRAIPKKAVVINLDDGYRSTYDIAYPILKKYGFTATLFIYTAFIGASRNALTWDQLKTMKADGFEVGCHSVNHVDLSKRMEGESEKEYLARIKKELLLSKQILDDRLNQDTRYIAFPYGEFSPVLLKLCEEIGYRVGFSVKSGGNPFFSEPLTLKRDQILKKDMQSFSLKLKTIHPISLK